MKKLLLVALMSGIGFAEVTKDDIKKLLEAQCSEELILSYVKANGPMAKLLPDDIVELKKVGATDKLLSALMEPQAEPAPKVTPAPAPKVKKVKSKVEVRSEPVPTVREVITVYRPAPRYWCSLHFCYDACGPVYYYPRVYHYNSYYPRTYYYTPGWCW